MFKHALTELSKLAADGDQDYQNYSEALAFYSESAEELDTWSRDNTRQGSSLVVPTNESWNNWKKTLARKNPPTTGDTQAMLQQHLLKKNVTPANLYRCCDKQHANRATVVDDIPVQQTMSRTGFPLIAQVTHDIDCSSIQLRKPMGMNASKPLYITKQPAPIAFSVPLNNYYHLVFLESGVLHG